MSDIQSFFQYYLTIQILGLSVWPLAKRLFPSFPDRGWAFTKILGILLVSWVSWWLGSMKAAPFTRTTLVAVITGIALTNWSVEFLLGRRKTQSSIRQLADHNSKLKTKNSFDIWHLKFVISEEIIFLASFAFWSWIRGFGPDIRGLEKFMDYGFMLSILRGEFFPPLDHFLSGTTINYYYFGHLIAALLSKLSGVAPEISFNLQIAHLFALTMLGGFSIGAALWSKKSVALNKYLERRSKYPLSIGLRGPITSGLLTALFITVIGNLHTILNIFREGESYWYPTATRLIPNTIHEFPIYSFVVADLHGHVSDLPIVLLVIGLLISYVFVQTTKPVETQKVKVKTKNAVILSDSEGSRRILNPIGILRRFAPQNDTSSILILTFATLTIGAMYATNSWDFPIYWTLTGFVFLYLYWKKDQDWLQNCISVGIKILPFFLLSILLFLPFHLTVRPIAKGIGIVHDWSHPYLWFQMWGFHTLLVLSFVGWIFRKQIKAWMKTESIVKIVAAALGVSVRIEDTPRVIPSTSEESRRSQNRNGILRSTQDDRRERTTDHLALILIGLSAILIILPEIIYMKDIYPTHYRANTMFKFFYQAWIMLGIATSYGMVRVIQWIRKHPSFFSLLLRTSYFVLLTSVMLYPYISLRSSTNRFRFNKGIDGTAWLEQQFPTDSQAIGWLNKNIHGQPAILEAVGESYTDYARISSNTGLPAVLGWPVHEWLWRGSYDEAGKRTADVQTIYESTDIQQSTALLEKYNVNYVYVGKMEEEKYPNLQKEKFEGLGEVVYENEEVKIYQIR